jgi:hypothetical protein
MIAPRRENGQDEWSRRAVSLWSAAISFAAFSRFPCFSGRADRKNSETKAAIYFAALHRRNNKETA